MSAETRDPWGAPVETHNILDDFEQPTDTYIGQHWFEVRPWLPAGSTVGRHMVERCCPDLAEGVDR